ncbi:Nitrilase/cyanide hydratase and apolipoprotein N-acyltransferase [Methanosalsum zhilinae DSM 4017]|uniref:Nitrilase/cyanide hydratase and apolipoprotein N-acyltransferase n=1 Tax=Methanosalsum zhilinae (strain DSM 4017 / NBRC 107636 / OCM 62 / WeN5) TaxID=679901 RepID=F7XLH9_METZD|nr:carbon-nitrogen family hydrolase [Methanosalsum zhilinae]AEH60707.1 Nitrilase/cyanide hydratase and apolipoprotein N-acyltransferase [Methanosalsum zhilinae DSM 4017]
MKNIRVSCIQMDISYCNKKENLQKAFLMADSAVSKGADIIVLPEVFSTGFCYERIEEVAEEHPYDTIQKIADFSKKNNCIMIGSIIEKNTFENNIEYYNLGYCIEYGQIAGFYRKIHPFTEEKKYFSPGSKVHTIPLRGCNLNIGLEICYEIRFPEIARKMALEGADILITIAEFPKPRSDIWSALAKARAIENQIPHVACNRTGSDPRKDYFGGSLIINAEGDILAEASDNETILIADIDTEQKNKIRSSIPVFADRRPELY